MTPLSLNQRPAKPVSGGSNTGSRGGMFLQTFSTVTRHPYSSSMWCSPRFTCRGIFLSMDMDKRTATISARVPAELEHQLQQIALAHDTTLSDLVCRALSELAETEHSRYLKLRAAFERGTDLPGKRDA